MTFRAASTALLTFSLMTAAATALAATLTGSGRSVTEDRAVAGYTGIALSIPGRVEVVQGATEGIRITADEDVTVSVGGQEKVILKMDVAGVRATVTVSSEAPLIEATQSQQESVVGQKLIENLPTNGRNFIDFVLTTPGVVRDGTRAGDISFAGQRGTLNSMVVDGANNDNTFFGQSLGRTGSGRAPYQFSAAGLEGY